MPLWPELGVWFSIMETAWRFLGRQHSLGSPLGGTVVDQRHLAHNKESRHSTLDSVVDKT